MTKRYLLRARVFQPKMIHNIENTLKNAPLYYQECIGYALALNAVKKWPKYFG